MHGLGNDFIVIDGINQNISEYSQLAIKACDRHFGVGADGMIIVERSDKADIKMIFYNGDGSQAEMCGNAMRCFAKHIYDNNIVNKEEFSVETLAGIMKPKLILEEGKIRKVKVNIGKPIFSTKLLPIITDEETFINREVEIEGSKHLVSFIMMACPHSVIFTDNLENIDINKLGPLIENNLIFPEGTNVNFSRVIDKNNIEVVTWERGVGQTLACGTGAAAVGVISSILNETEKRVNIHSLGGVAEIEVLDDFVYLTGPAELICRGEYYF